MFVFFRVTEKSPQSIWRSGSAAGSRGRREERSKSAPERICARILWDTGGGSMVTELDGTGIGVAVKGEYGDLICMRELGTSAAASRLDDPLWLEKES